METLVKNVESEKDGNSLPKHLSDGEPLSEHEIKELLDEAELDEKELSLTDVTEGINRIFL